MLTMTDRRHNMRLNTSMPARCDGARATILNLSPSGARVVLGPRAATAGRLQLVFFLGSRRFQLAVEVSWSERVGSSTVVGARFVDIGEVEQHELRNHVIRSHYGLSAAA